MSFKERYLRGDCSIDMVNDYVEMSITWSCSIWRN